MSKRTTQVHFPAVCPPHIHSQYLLHQLLHHLSWPLDHQHHVYQFRVTKLLKLLFNVKCVSFVGMLYVVETMSMSVSFSLSFVLRVCQASFRLHTANPTRRFAVLKRKSLNTGCKWQSNISATLLLRW